VIAGAVDFWRNYGEEFYVCSAGAGIGVSYEPDDLELMVTAPELILRKTMLQSDYAIAVGRAIVEAGLPPVMAGGGDLAGSQGPIYSPRMFRDLVLPAYVKAVHELNRMGVHYYFRSDGNLWPLMDMLFAEAACPGFGETDRDAAMTLAAVRARFPRLVIWGNVSSNLLMHGAVGEVRAQAEATLAEAGGRGYFQGCSNAIVQGTPAENVRAMFAVR
jgi:uroporphyrinogen-III decarboxylase